MCRNTIQVISSLVSFFPICLKNKMNGRYSGKIPRSVKLQYWDKHVSPDNRRRSLQYSRSWCLMHTLHRFVQMCTYANVCTFRGHHPIGNCTAALVRTGLCIWNPTSSDRNNTRLADGSMSLPCHVAPHLSHVIPRVVLFVVHTMIPWILCRWKNVSKT